MLRKVFLVGLRISGSRLPIRAEGEIRVVRDLPEHAQNLSARS